MTQVGGCSNKYKPSYDIMKWNSPEVFRFMAEWKNHVFGICLHYWHSLYLNWNSFWIDTSSGGVSIMLIVVATCGSLIYRSARITSFGLWTKIYNIIYKYCSGHVTRVIGFVLNSRTSRRNYRHCKITCILFLWQHSQHQTDHSFSSFVEWQRNTTFIHLYIYLFF